MPRHHIARLTTIIALMLGLLGLGVAVASAATPSHPPATAGSTAMATPAVTTPDGGTGPRPCARRSPTRRPGWTGTRPATCR